MGWIKMHYFRGLLKFRKFIYYVEELKSNKKPTGFPAGFGFH